MRLKLELDDKIKEVDLLISELKCFEQMSGKIKANCILKSTVFMMLYNIIESMLNLILQEIHDNISDTNYECLNTRIKKIYIQHHIVSNALENTKKIDKIISKELKLALRYFPWL